MLLIRSRMSSARQAVHRAESFTGFGKRPDLTPSHQLVLPRGMTLSTCGNRKNPVSGISFISTLHCCRGTAPRLIRAAPSQDGFTLEAPQLLVAPLSRERCFVARCHNLP